MIGEKSATTSFWTAMSFLVALGTSVRAQTVEARLQQTGSIDNPLLREASGVAVSVAHEGVLWVHNDSGDEPRIYAIGYDGHLLATFHVRGARADDWEDIALGPCPGSTGTCIFIADTGDNNRRRQSVSIYIVPEPDPGSGSPDSVVDTARAERLRFTYPGGAAYDVEGLAVSSAGDILLVSKGRRPGSGIVQFRIAAADVGDGDVVAELVARLPIVPMRQLGRWVTGAAMSPSGTRVVVRTYTELYFFTYNSDGTLTPDPPVCWVGAAEPQGEAVDFVNEETLVLVSESLLDRRGTIFRASCPRE